MCSYEDFSTDHELLTMNYSITTSLHAEKVLGIKITTEDKKKILENIHEYMVQGSGFGVKPLIIFTPNPEQIVLAQKNHSFHETLNRADLVLPDGIGVLWALKKPFDHRISGIDFMMNLIAYAEKESIKIGFIGGRDKIALKALECLQNKHPKLQGWVAEPEETTIEELASKILKTHTKMIFVGLGAPKQEFFIEKLSAYYQPLTTNPILFMSVGGSFDMIAGRVKRSPYWMRNSGLEWLWRLIIEPWRWKRQLALLHFAALVLKSRSRGYLKK